MTPSTQNNQQVPNDTSLDKSEQQAVDVKFMKRAIELASIAERHDEIPVGAIVVDTDGNIIGEGYNQSIMNNDPSAHAEMIAIRQAGQVLQNYRMLDCTLYVTLEPCPMCAGLLVHSRIKRVVFASHDEKTGSAGSVFNLVSSDKLNHCIEVTENVLGEQCSAMLSAFFKRRRKEIKALKQLKKQQISKDHNQVLRDSD